jgi:hypothetical protein
MQEYRHTIDDAETRLNRLEGQLTEVVPQWSMALVVGSVRREPIPAQRSNPAEPGARSAIIHVFAAMAMKVNNRRMP